MHVVLATVGTNGDVRPFVAIGKGLAARGHRVTIATHTDYEALIRSHGLGFRPVGGSFKQLLESEQGRQWIESADSLRRYAKTTRAVFDGLLPQWIGDLEAAVADADAVVAHCFALGTVAPCEKRGIPLALVGMVPFIPTAEIPPAFFLSAPWGWLRKWLQAQSLSTVGAIQVPHLNRQREALGLPSIVASDFKSKAFITAAPWIHLYSEHVQPRPSDWPDHAHVTGFCFLDEPAWTPPPELERFLASGERPIYVGFGSMTGKDPAELTKLVIEAVRRAKQRAVIISGWGGVAADHADDVYVADNIPHDWLLARVSAVVHHGGAGTLAAGLRAGKPTQVVAFFGDQPYWGSRNAAIGAGPKTILKKDLTAESLANAIGSLVSEPRWRDGAAAVAERLRAEDGVAAACDRIEAISSARSPASERRPSDAA